MRPDFTMPAHCFATTAGGKVIPSKTLRFLANQIDHSAAIVISSQERRFCSQWSFCPSVKMSAGSSAPSTWMPRMSHICFVLLHFKVGWETVYWSLQPKGQVSSLTIPCFFRTTLTLIRRLTSSHAKILHFLGAEQFQMLLHASSLYPPKFISSYNFLT